MDIPYIKLIFFGVIALISLVSKVMESFAEKKRQREEAESHKPLRPSPTATPPLKPVLENWEVEMRRIFGEEPPAPAPKPVLPPPLLPPIPTSSSRANIPPPPHAPPRTEPAALPRPVAAVNRGSAAVAAAAHLAESAVAYGRGAALVNSVSGEMSEVDALTVAHPVVRPVSHLKCRSAQAQTVVSLLKKPDSARQVLLASMILNPPASLSNHA